MKQALHGLHWRTLLLYLDDVILIFPYFVSCLHRLKEVFKRLQDAGFKLKPTKCELLQNEVRYVGHVVSVKGVATNPEKVEAVKKWEPPKDANLYRHSWEPLAIAVNTCQTMPP